MVGARLSIVAEFVGQHIAKYKPTFGSVGAAGADLCADIESEMYIAPGTHALIPTGIKLSLPPFTEGQVRSRSGLAAKNGVFVLNSPGTVDSDYRGEIKIILANVSSTIYKLSPGDRIAQIIIAPVLPVTFVEGEVHVDTNRGIAGFGSTGTGAAVGVSSDS
jgi:dUTP pyrophosphatase